MSTLAAAGVTHIRPQGHQLLDPPQHRLFDGIRTCLQSSADPVRHRWLARCSGSTSRSAARLGAAAQELAHRAPTELNSRVVVIGYDRRFPGAAGGSDRQRRAGRTGTAAHGNPGADPRPAGRWWNARPWVSVITAVITPEWLASRSRDPWWVRRGLHRVERRLAAGGSPHRSRPR